MKKDAQDHYIKYRSLYEEAIKEHVCSHCIDMTGSGRCSKSPKECAVLRFVPELVEIALEMHEKKIAPYVKLVRERICMKCGGSPDGEHCARREMIDCDLDRYLPMVLNAIEDVQEKINRPGSEFIATEAFLGHNALNLGGIMAYQGGGGFDGGRPKEMFKATCAECHKECDVPFKPSGDRPVYCKECFSKRKNSGR